VQLVLYALIQTARFNPVDPHARLADVLARINDQASPLPFAFAQGARDATLFAGGACFRHSTFDFNALPVPCVTFPQITPRRRRTFLPTEHQTSNLGTQNLVLGELDLNQ
jgi:hypothetical protein